MPYEMTNLSWIGEVYPYMSREEKKRLWAITIERIILYKERFQIKWKNNIKTQGSFKAVSMSGAEGGI